MTPRRRLQRTQRGGAPRGSPSRPLRRSIAPCGRAGEEEDHDALHIQGTLPLTAAMMIGKIETIGGPDGFPLARAVNPLQVAAPTSRRWNTARTSVFAKNPNSGTGACP